MLDLVAIKNRIRNLKNEREFNEIALALYELHATHNSIYRTFILSLPSKHHQVDHYSKIPCLPIEFFKSKRILLEGLAPEIIFESSGTTGKNTSKHYVADKGWYIDNSLRNFELFYGTISEYCILALLPSYLERKGSSLVLMAEELIKKSDHDSSGFYLNDFSKLRTVLLRLRKEKQKTLLLGVSFALLDFIENDSLHFPELILMETGGMKGKRKEMIREELHRVLEIGFDIKNVHSEYGMTELLSQGYSKGKGVFSNPPWMKFLIRDSNDPFSYLAHGQTGGINVIDLANFHTCPFIATQDLGRSVKNGTEILGRFDNSDIRGCNLMVI